LEPLIDGKKKDFAERIGISAKQLSSLLAGRTPPSRLLLKRLATVLRVREEWLETGEPPMRGARSFNPGRMGAGPLAEADVRDALDEALDRNEAATGWTEVNCVRVGDVEVIVRQRRPGPEGDESKGDNT